MGDHGTKKRGLIQGLGTWNEGLNLGVPITPKREVIKGFGLSIPLT